MQSVKAFLKGSVPGLLKGIDNLSEWTGKIFSWTIIPLLLLVIYEVVSRYFLRRPHVWAPEVGWYLYGIHFMMLAAYTHLHGGHVNVDILYKRFSPRGRTILDIITYLIFFFPFLTIVFVWGISFAQASWATAERSAFSQLAFVPYFKTVIPIAALLLLLQGLSNFIRALFFLSRGKNGYGE